MQKLDQGIVPVEKLSLHAMHSKQELSLLSPAKLNLFFRVLKKRSDGFHEIASLFQAIDLYDRIIFHKAEENLFTCSDESLPVDSDNLVVQAWQLYKRRAALPFGVRIHLEKIIPMQAGLGGGSSNAATVLWGLNELSGRPLTLEQLIEMGMLLGSDVPFFFSLGTAYCTGRGEIMEPVELPHLLTGWVAKPSYGLSTPLVYRETKIEELPSRDPRNDLHQYPVFYNDLERAALRLEPRLLAFRKTLETMGFDSVTMTGSGTAFFCIGDLYPSNCSSCLGTSATGGARQALIPFRSISRNSGHWYTDS